MTDIAVAIASTEISILDVAKQASGLAIGLQNAAPSDKLNSPNRSIQYLLEIAERLNEVSAKCKKLLAHDSKEQGNKLLELTAEAVQYDKDLREKYQIADKFRFIRDRLTAQHEGIQETVNSMRKETAKYATQMGEDEALIYVYLFNAQGISLQTWNKMINPAVFYDHSVNRPIYLEKSHIETFVNHKANKVQHGYLTIIIKKQDIFQGESTGLLKDSYNNPLIKVKEGSLKFDKLVAFTHNGHDYIVSEEGLIRKPSSD